MGEKLYRVVDNEGKVYDNRGWIRGNGQIRPFTQLSKAKAARTKHQKSANLAMIRNGTVAKVFKVQETETEWHDVPE